MMNSRSMFPTAAVALLLLFSAGQAHAEQKKRLGEYDVHYAVVQSTFFSEDIALQYDIVRGPDRALVNLSILDDQDRPVAVALEGTATNLLGQTAGLDFREIREGPAIYYLADVRYTDRDTLRFRVRITTPDGRAHTLEFQQQMFRDGR